MSATLPPRTMPEYGSAAQQALYRKLNWRLLPFLLLCYTFAYLDRVNIGFAKLQMQSDLGISDAVFSSGPAPPAGRSPPPICGSWMG